MGGSNGAVFFPHARQQQARPPHVDALPDPQLQLAIAFARQVCQQRRGRYGGAAGGRVLGKAARSRKKHPRLQVAGPLGRRHVAGVDVDADRAVAGQHAGKGRRLGLCPPQRVARG